MTEIPPIQINQDRLIELGLFSSELANHVQKLAELGNTIEDDSLRDFFQLLIEGFLSVPESQHDYGPFLRPLTIEGADLVIQNPDGSDRVMAIRDSEGTFQSVWITDNFMERLRFLRTGMINLSFTTDQLPPVSLRLDSETFFKKVDGS